VEQIEEQAAAAEEPEELELLAQVYPHQLAEEPEELERKII
tara:strand:+ start:442 stop:564 length:123 start_codon:yes stop_codon:yes gene_type:complete